MDPVDSVRVENVVGSTDVEVDLDLTALFNDLEDAEYDPARFPGLKYRTVDPAATTLVFRSGKLVTTGAQSETAVRAAVEQVVAQLDRLGIAVPSHPIVTIENIVCTADLGEQFNLNVVAIGLGLERIEYEPEQFPGLVLRLDQPGVVVLLFGSGKLVITGASQRGDAERAVGVVRERLGDVTLLD